MFLTEAKLLRKALQHGAPCQDEVAELNKRKQWENQLVHISRTFRNFLVNLKEFQCFQLLFWLFLYRRMEFEKNSFSDKSFEPMVWLIGKIEINLSFSFFLVILLWIIDIFLKPWFYIVRFLSIFFRGTFLKSLLEVVFQDGALSD